jgi:hypothetical protein
MKPMDKIIEEAVDAATKPKFFTKSRIIGAVVALAVVTGAVMVAKVVKNSHEDQEIDHNEVIVKAEEAAIVKPRAPRP